MDNQNYNCIDDPRELYNRRVCLFPVSKDVKGELKLLDRDVQKCEEQECVSLKADWLMKSEVQSHKPCDSDASQTLNGVFHVRQLVTAFVDGSGENRGIHTGTFEWHGNGAVVRGSLSGVTNAGTHRKPAFEECQKCHAPGDMEGQLCGVIVKTEDKRLRGCHVKAAYRFRFDASEGAIDTTFQGTLEGLIVCPCGKAKCIDFRQFPVLSHPNPWTVDDCIFLVKDWQGNATSTADVVTWGGVTGLNANYETGIALANQASNVSITLVHFSARATVVALDSSGVAVDSQTMVAGNGVVETLHLSGTGIESLIVRPPQNETLILEICTS